MDPSSALAGELSALSRKAVGFLSGAAAGVALHEGGHHLAEAMLGWEDVEGGGKPRGSNATRNVALGGFAVDVVASNIIMSADTIPKDNAFILGVLAFELLNPLIYIARHESHGYGDLEAYKEAGGDVALVEVGLILTSAFNLYRLYKDPGFRVFVKTTKEETSILLKWKF